MIFVFDVLFLILLFLFNVLVSKIFMAVGFSSFILYLLIFFANLLVIILLYSFFKLKILGVMLTFTGKNIINIKKCYLRFVALNAIIAIIFSLCAFILGLIVMSMIKAEVQQQVLTILIFILGIFFYAFLQPVHIYFIRTNSIIQSIKKSYSLMSTSLSYKPLFALLLLFLLFLIVMFILNLFIGYILLKINAFYAITTYSLILTILNVIWVYLILSFNKLYYSELLK